MAFYKLLYFLFLQQFILHGEKSIRILKKKTKNNRILKSKKTGYLSCFLLFYVSILYVVSFFLILQIT